MRYNVLLQDSRTVEIPVNAANAWAASNEAQRLYREDPGWAKSAGTVDVNVLEVKREGD